MVGAVSSWKATVDPKTGKKFYVNAETGATSWRPTKASFKDDSPAGWHAALDRKDRMYYINDTTKETRWKRPPG